jgi:protein O-mannosyl-transferase
MAVMISSVMPPTSVGETTVREALRTNPAKPGFHAWIVVVVILAAFIPYALSLGYGFIYDDHQQIEENAGLRAGLAWDRAFISDVWAMTGSTERSNYYRPLMWVAYDAIFSVAGLAPLAFHLFNLSLHVSVCIVLFFLTMQLFRDERIAGIAAILFAVHPIHTEPIVWIAAVPELAFTLCVLCAVYFYTLENRPELHVSAAFATALAIGLLWKESAITFLPIAFLYDILVRKQFRFRRYALLAAVTALYLGLRALALGGVAPNIVYPNVPAIAQVFTALSNLGMYIAKLVVPHPLTFVYPIRFPDHVTIPALVPVLALVVTALFFRRKTAWASLWILAALLPTLAVTRVVIPFAERNLYLASVGFVWLIAVALRKLNWRATVGVTAVLVLAYGIADWARVREWADDLPLFQADLRRDPANAPARLLLAAELGRRGRYGEALLHLDTLIGADSKNVDALTSKAGILVTTQDWNGVRSTCRQVLEMDPVSARCFLDLGYADEQQGQAGAALANFERAYRLNSGLWQALFHQGNIALQGGNFGKAAETFETVAKRNPTAQVLNNLGTAYAQLGQVQRAIGAFQASLRADPSFEMAQRNLAIAMSDSN